MKRVQRYDFGAFRSKPHKTQQGFLKLSGNLTRTGVLTYRRADGSLFRELRDPAEVFKADSLATLEGAPVTNLHPGSGEVTPANVTEHQRGFVSGAVREDEGRFVAAEITVQEAHLIGQVESGDRVECSPGYTCHVDETPGVFQGERYDGVQRDIVYNHLALLPKGAGRSGSEVALHLDGADPSVGVEFRTDDRPETPTKETKKMETQVIRIDGIEYTVEKTAAPHIEKAIGARDAKAAAATADLDKLTARADAAEKERDEAKAKLDTIDVSALVNARVALEGSARKLLGDEFKTDGMSDSEIRLAAIVKAEPEFKADGKSDEYVTAYFDAVAGRKVVKADASEAARKAIEDNKGTGKLDPHDVKGAMERNMQRNQDAWQQPLAYTKDARN